VITSNVGSILIITGALTASALALFVAPLWVTRRAFGETPPGPVNLAIARHWGLLLFCVGALLVYAAFHPAVRVPTVVLAAVEKAGFVACILGTSLRQRPIPLTLAIGDAVMVSLYVLYLVGA
jgi:hypothetical protein